MKIYKLVVLLLRINILVLFCTYFVSCNDKSRSRAIENKTPKDSLMAAVPATALFYKNQISLNEIVAELNVDSIIKKGELSNFEPADFSSELGSKMHRLGITNVIYYKMYCDSTINNSNTLFEFDFTTNWNDKTRIHITKEPCLNSYNKVGDYLKRKNGNEVWGLGDNWVIWYEHSPVSSDTFPPKYRDKVKTN